jgi:hypothetical protein
LAASGADSQSDAYKREHGRCSPDFKFTTLFGMLAMEIAISQAFSSAAPIVGVVFFAVALVFVWRSFYGMRIIKDKEKEEQSAAKTG